MIVVGGSFYGGMIYEKSHVTSDNVRTGGPQMGRAGGSLGMTNGQRRVGGGNGFGMLAGEVVSKDDSSFTLKLRDGSSKIVFYASSTSVGKMAQGSLQDIIEGAEVTVNGSSNADGSVVASMVQLRPVSPRPSSF